MNDELRTFVYLSGLAFAVGLGAGTAYYLVNLVIELMFDAYDRALIRKRRKQLVINEALSILSKEGGSFE